jgi:hypothetical protein
LGSTDDAELPGAIVLQPQREYADEANTKSTFAERFREEGRAQGVQQGVQQGMQRGEAAVLTRQLERKFGPVPEAARQRIEAADEETLVVVDTVEDDSNNGEGSPGLIAVSQRLREKAAAEALALFVSVNTEPGEHADRQVTRGKAPDQIRRQVTEIHLTGIADQDIRAAFEQVDGRQVDLARNPEAAMVHMHADYPVALVGCPKDNSPRCG